jgi:hypothetical protein
MHGPEGASAQQCAGATRQALPGPVTCGSCHRSVASYNRCTPGSGSLAGWASEAAVVPVEPQDNTTCGEGRAAASSVRSVVRRGPVSAGQASPAASGSRVVRDPVRALQHALYRAAKADPGRRFHALYDKVSRSDVLWRAWVAVRRNNGAPGIDKITLAAVGEYGVSLLLDELAAELKEGRYRPVPARRVYIPKPGVRDEQRPLSIPSVRDRIVQAAVKIVLEPVFEADQHRVC